MIAKMISRQCFEAIFEKCMTQDTYLHEDGSESKLSPCLIVRNVDSKTEHEFTDEQKAWAYVTYGAANYMILLDVTGGIYADVIGGEDNE